MIAAATVITAVIAGYCVWMRRGAWGCRWELAGTVVAAAMFACLILISPVGSRALSTPIHALTGLWNVEDLLGHLVYLAALATLIHSLVYRINLDRPEQFIRRRLEMPISLALPLLIGLFVVAVPDEHYSDLFQGSVGGMMTAYWVALCAAASYLLIQLVGLLWVVRRDPRSTATANIYIAAIIVDSGCVASIVVSRIIPAYPTAVTWTLLCVAASGYAIAPAYSWHRKTRRTPGPAPLPQ